MSLNYFVESAKMVLVFVVMLVGWLLFRMEGDGGDVGWLWFSMEGDGGEMRGEIKGDGGGFAWKVMVLHIYIMREREGVFWSRV